MNQETHQLTFKQEIDRINVSAYDQFNWFRVMYKMTEERNLHSRFIAFLLNPDGSHEQGDTFLKLFLEEFNVTGFDLDGVRVLPDEQEKREADNIDVLITNKKQQAILIENKLFAGDSNKHEGLDDEIGDDTHKYQIPRYYYRITNKGYAVTHIFYLTVKFNKPSYYEEFPDEVKAVLHFRDYIKSIIDWVGKCIDAYGTDDVFRGGLEQYQQAMIGFLSDYRLALDLKAISARYPEEASAFWNTRNEADTARDKIIKDQLSEMERIKNDIALQHLIQD